MKVSIAMLGSRNHYIMPVILAKNDLLDTFYTDSYIGNKPFLKFIISTLYKLTGKNEFKKWLSREHSLIPPDKVKSYEVLGIKYAFLRRKAKSWQEMENIYANINSEFCNTVVKDLKKKVKNISYVYGFNGASLELVQFCKEKGVKFILEQTLIPHKVEYEILNEEISKWKGIERNEVFRDTNSPLVLRELEELKLADIVIAPSKFVFDTLLNMGIDKFKIKLIPYGIETEKFPYRVRRFEGNRPLKVLFAGEVGLRKGAPYLLEALAILGPKRVKAKFAGIISLKKEFLNKYTEVAEFLGPVPKTEMVKLFEWADVFVLPSLAEGFGLVIFEALSTGLPVITTPNTIALNGIVSHMKTGQIIPIRDSNAIVDALKLYIENPELLEEYSKNILSIRDYLDVSRYERDILNLFSEIEHNG